MKYSSKRPSTSDQDIDNRMQLSTKELHLADNREDAYAT